MALFFYQFTPLYGHNQKFRKGDVSSNRGIGILIEQEMLSTVFDKKVCFHVSKLKKCWTKSVVSRDFLRSAFNLFQEENGTFFPISF